MTQVARTHQSATELERLRDAVRRGVLGQVTGPRVREWEQRARLNVMVRRGEAAPEVIAYDHPDGAVSYFYVRLKQPARRWPVRTIIALHVAGFLSAAAWLLWESRWVLLAAVIAIAGLALLIITARIISALSGQSCSCIIHGPRCQR